jgi:hypothetical protein
MWNFRVSFDRKKTFGPSLQVARGAESFRHDSGARSRSLVLHFPRRRPVKKYYCFLSIEFLIRPMASRPPVLRKKAVCVDSL